MWYPCILPTTLAKVIQPGPEILHYWQLVLCWKNIFFTVFQLQSYPLSSDPIGRTSISLATLDRERRKSVDSDPQRHHVLARHSTSDISRKKYQALLLSDNNLCSGFGVSDKVFRTHD